MEELAKRVTALGTLIRAGVETASAAETVGLQGLDFRERSPLTWRTDGEAT